MVKSNSSQVLYATDSYVVSITTSPDCRFILSGHLDCSIWKYSSDNNQIQKFILHQCIPYCLTWGNDIMIAGNDSKVVFYNDSNGNKAQVFDYTHDDKVKDFTVAKINPSNDCVAVGNFNRFFIYLFNNRKQQWEEVSYYILYMKITNLYDYYINLGQQ